LRSIKICLASRATRNEIKFSIPCALKESHPLGLPEHENATAIFGVPHGNTIVQKRYFDATSAGAK
jgi:hypothetical protein